jgi:hypothetical protein
MSRTVVTGSHQTVVTQSSQSRTVVTGQLGPPGPPGAGTFTELKDIDLSQLGSGSMLVYNTTTNKWTATNLLEQQTVECGQF